MYYTCFDNTFDWDANRNGIYGEITDNIDLYPEISISRLPAQTNTNISLYISKLINYEKNPIYTLHNSNRRLLLAGRRISNDTNDTQFNAYKMYNDYLQNISTDFIFDSDLVVVR